MIKNELAQGGFRIPEPANGIQVNFCKKYHVLQFRSARRNKEAA